MILYFEKTHCGVFSLINLCISGQQAVSVSVLSAYTVLPSPSPCICDGPCWIQSDQCDGQVARISRSEFGYR